MTSSVNNGLICGVLCIFAYAAECLHLFKMWRVLEISSFLYCKSLRSIEEHCCWTIFIPQAPSTWLRSSVWPQFGWLFLQSFILLICWSCNVWIQVFIGTLMATHFFACSWRKTSGDIQLSQHHTVWRLMLSFGARALTIKVPHLLATCLQSYDCPDS